MADGLDPGAQAAQQRHLEFPADRGEVTGDTAEFRQHAGDPVDDLDVGGARLPDHEDRSRRNLCNRVIAVDAVRRAARLSRRRHGPALQQGLAVVVTVFRRFIGCLGLRRPGVGR